MGVIITSKTILYAVPFYTRFYTLIYTVQFEVLKRLLILGQTTLINGQN